ncbi:lysyl-tRNA synthetase [Streptococcus pneumoniae]|uniref:lysyl-tRNA synthetase n=1 Tax=Streptococcus pneumoniae TaxID=1313 RepID=UPI000B595CF8|nr:lysyl-tRNA synthetase [Streptococcus pneumoniae]
MKIKEQTRKLAAGCESFEVADKTDEVSNHTHSKATLTRFEEIFEEYKNPQDTFFYPLVYKENTY